MATIICENHRPQMSTVRPGVMQKLDEDTSLEAEIEKFEVEFTEEDFNIEILEEKVSTKKMIKIEDADILVSAGRGFGGKERIEEEAQDLAKALDAVVRVSYVDAGWLAKELKSVKQERRSSESLWR